jgi:hypothetical protein
MINVFQKLTTVWDFKKCYFFVQFFGINSFQNHNIGPWSNLRSRIRLCRTPRGSALTGPAIPTPHPSAASGSEADFIDQFRPKYLT